MIHPKMIEQMSIIGDIADDQIGLFTDLQRTDAIGKPQQFCIGAGGVLYSAGVIFHAWRGLRFQNAIWHGFVLTAALCHYAAVVTSVAG